MILRVLVMEEEMFLGIEYINYKGDDFDGQYGQGWADITLGSPSRDFSKFAVFF